MTWGVEVIVVQRVSERVIERIRNIKSIKEISFY